MKGERMSGTILNDGLAKELEKVCESRHRTITYIGHQISLSVMPGINKMPDCIHPSYWCGTIQLYSKPTAHSILVALMNYVCTITFTLQLSTRRSQRGFPEQ